MLYYFYLYICTLVPITSCTDDNHNDYTHYYDKFLNKIICEDDVSFSIVEQNANLAMKYPDYCYVFENETVVVSGEANKLSARDDIKEFYLGANNSKNTKKNKS